MEVQRSAKISKSLSSREIAEGDKDKMNPGKINNFRDKIIPVLEPYGIKRVALFGSVARGEETPESDIDLLVTLEQPVGLFKWIELKEELSKRLGRKVDMGSVLKERIRPIVEKEMIVLYENPKKG